MGVGVEEVSQVQIGGSDIPFRLSEMTMKTQFPV